MWEKVSEFISALVRPGLAFLFAGAITWGFVAGRITGEAFLSVAGTVIAFYFGSRSNEKPAPVVVTDRRNPPPIVEGDVETVNVNTPRRRAS